ncbi:hypothetical protein E4U43_001282 [Claviceps pusilla]|uniref:Cytochrome P450 n=1 Tax=Claviceps pusilla TaxID=123648 RepID=A0A9P7NAF5_9HYPO|nr:hypothetical protein E4U43_001282 [Claviceps pusilla]
MPVALIGPIVRVSPTAVAVANIEDLKTIYTIKETYRKSEFYQLMTGGSQSVFGTTNVERHRKLRRLLAAQMSETSLKSMLPQISSHVDLAIRKMKEEAEARGVIDVYKWCTFLTTDVVGELSFGESFHMLERGKKNQYIEDVENITIVGAYRAAFPLLLGLIAKHNKMLPFLNKVLSMATRLRDYSTQSLAKYQKQVETDPAKAKKTFFAKLFKAEEDEKLGFDDIVANGQTFIIAGSDTTANTLTYLLWAISKRPDLRAALLKELRALPKDFAESDLRGLPLLNQTIEETLRLYPAVPAMLPRTVPAGGAHLSGYYLKEGTWVGAQAYTMNRDPTIFENPETFDPQRWANPTKAMREAFMTYGLGSRVCIGMHLANIELRLTAARFLLEFPNARVSTRQGMSDTDMDMTAIFLLAPRGKRCLIEV